MASDESTIKQGDLILKSKPFAYVACDAYRGRVCDYCLIKKDNLRMCTQCSFSYYCDRKCQKSAWKDHKQECINLKKCYFIPGVDARLMARIIYKLKTKPDEFEQVGNITRRFQDLMSHSENIRNDFKRMSQFRISIEETKAYIPPEICPSYDELIDIISKIAINGYGIFYDNELRGVGLFLGASVFYHSCQPNAVMVFDGSTMLIKALKNIPQQDIPSNVFIPYTDVFALTEERQQELKSKYYFDCNCARCQDEEKDLMMNSILCPNKNCTHPVTIKMDSCKCLECGEVIIEKHVLDEVQEMTGKCKFAFEILTDLKEIKKFNEIYTLAKGYIEEAKLLFHLLNVHYVRILDFAFDACLVLENWEPAVDLAKDILVSYRYYHGNIHPNVGGLIFKLGQLQCHSQKLSDAELTLQEALDILLIIYGKNHKFYVSCLELLLKCQMANIVLKI